MKNLLLTIIVLASIGGCTHLSEIHYQITAEDNSEFTEEDLTKISEYLVKEQDKEKINGKTQYYLSRGSGGIAPTDILTIEKNEKGLKFSVTRLSDFKGFSKSWIEKFENGSKQIVEYSTAKKVMVVKINE